MTTARAEKLPRDGQIAAPLAAMKTATEAFAWSFAVITVGMAAGNAIGGLVIQHANPEAAFMTAAALSLAGALFGGARLAVRQHQQPAQPSGQGSRPSEAALPQGVAGIQPVHCCDQQAARERGGCLRRGA